MLNGGNRILPTGTPIVNAAIVPTTAIPTTITSSCLSPVRKSSWRPAPARLASFGQQRSLHGLEQQWWDPGDEERGRERGDRRRCRPGPSAC